MTLISTTFESSHLSSPMHSCCLSLYDSGGQFLMSPAHLHEPCLPALLTVTFPDSCRQLNSVSHLLAPLPRSVGVKGDIIHSRGHLRGLCVPVLPPDSSKILTLDLCPRKELQGPEGKNTTVQIAVTPAAAHVLSPTVHSQFPCAPSRF